MRSVNVAELKDKLSKYLGFAKEGEEVVIRDRNLPVAKLVPFRPENAPNRNYCLWQPVRCDCQRLDWIQRSSKEFPRVR
jgi:prevent-host-death family protein